jgi:hypothetical protein
MCVFHLAIIEDFKLSQRFSANVYNVIHGIFTSKIIS